MDTSGLIDGHVENEASGSDVPLARLEFRFRRQNIFLRVWRIGHLLHRRGVPWVPQAIRILCQIIFHADVPVTVDIPEGVVFMHNGLGCVVHPRANFRGPAIVFHHVTIGNRHTADDGTPVIGRRVFVGAGAVIVGGIEIGDDCFIGANAVVTSNVPAGHRATGNPARVRPCPGRLMEALFPRPGADGLKRAA